MMVTVSDTKNEPEVMTALLAVARTVAKTHDARNDKTHTICSVCAALLVLDRILPGWQIAVLQQM